jgi:hypothetical protein
MGTEGKQYNIKYSNPKLMIGFDIMLYLYQYALVNYVLICYNRRRREGQKLIDVINNNALE